MHACQNTRTTFPIIWIRPYSHTHTWDLRCVCARTHRMKSPGQWHCAVQPCFGHSHPRRSIPAGDQMLDYGQHHLCTNITVLHTTVLHTTVLPITVLHITVLHITVLHITVLHFTVLHVTADRLGAHAHRGILDRYHDGTLSLFQCVEWSRLPA